MSTEPGPDGEPRLVRCRRCHRLLTDPATRARQLGDDCAEAEFAARQGGIEQETLPGL